MQITPYVIFDDLALSLKNNNKIKGLKSFDVSYLGQMSQYVQNILSLYFPNVGLVTSDNIERGIDDFVRSMRDHKILSLSPLLKQGTQVDEIGLSHLYAPHAGEGDVCHHDYLGFQPRYTQSGAYEAYIKTIQETYRGQTVSIVDDVIFSGRSVLHLLDVLTAGGVQVRTVFTNVITGEAYQNLSSQGIEVRYLHRYDSVVDIVCMRDFIFGIPDGGMNFLQEDQSILFSTYIIPFGDIKKWASIDRRYKEHFSYHMLKIAAQFWHMLEACNNRPFTLADLSKQPTIWPAETDNIAKGLLSIMNSFENIEPLAAKDISSYDTLPFADNDTDSKRCAAGVRGG